MYYLIEFEYQRKHCTEVTDYYEQELNADKNSFTGCCFFKQMPSFYNSVLEINLNKDLCIVKWLIPLKKNSAIYVYEYE